MAKRCRLHLCEAVAVIDYGYRFHECRKPVKWFVRTDRENSWTPACGRHARKGSYYVKKYGRRPFVERILIEEKL
ncbi:MAG: hypothetical protein V3T30_04440 [Thermodesulfobacteriota bacterium]